MTAAKSAQQVVDKYGAPETFTCYGNAMDTAVADSFELFRRGDDPTSVALAREIATRLSDLYTSTRQSSTYAAAVSHADMFDELGIDASEREYAASRGGIWKQNLDGLVAYCDSHGRDGVPVDRFMVSLAQVLASF